MKNCVKRDLFWLDYIVRPMGLTIAWFCCFNCSPLQRVVEKRRRAAKIS
jgi:hypothetical protein